MKCSLAASCNSTNQASFVWLPEPSYCSFLSLKCTLAHERNMAIRTTSPNKALWACLLWHSCFEGAWSRENLWLLSAGWARAGSRTRETHFQSPAICQHTFPPARQEHSRRSAQESGNSWQGRRLSRRPAPLWLVYPRRPILGEHPSPPRTHIRPKPQYCLVHECTTCWWWMHI